MVTTSYETSSTLVPVLGVFEIRPVVAGAVRPYLGMGAGWEGLEVETRDYVTGVVYHDHFGGFGWQPYGGIDFMLGRNAALSAEAYGNLATVERTFYDYWTGYGVHQEIDANGFGLRGGLSFGF